MKWCISDSHHLTSLFFLFSEFCRLFFTPSFSYLIYPRLIMLGDSSNIMSFYLDFHFFIWSMITSGENGNNMAFKFLWKIISNPIWKRWSSWHLTLHVTTKLQYKLLKRVYMVFHAFSPLCFKVKLKLRAFFTLWLELGFVGRGCVFSKCKFASGWTAALRKGKRRWVHYYPCVCLI